MSLEIGRRRVRLFVAMLITTVLPATGSCTKYTPVARSDWDSASFDGPADWKIETSTTIYRVQQFATTDSTLLLTDASQRERIGGTNYPGSSVRAIKDSELPIELPIADVISIEQGQYSRGRTIAAVLGVAATACVAAAVAFWIYAESHGGLY